MKCLIILSAVFAAVSCLYAAPIAGYRGDPSLARILSDQRAHQTSGDFAVAFKSEDGTAYSEKATALDGTRRGQYSYVDDLGQTQNVKWGAGPEVSKSSALTTNQLTHSKHRHSKQQLITWLDYMPLQEQELLNGSG